MFGFLIALILLAPALCAVAPAPAVASVVKAGTVAAATPSRSVRTDCAVAARSAGGTARNGRIEDEGCAGGGSVPAVGPGRVVPDLRAVGVVAAR